LRPVVNADLKVITTHKKTRTIVFSPKLIQTSRNIPNDNTSNAILASFESIKAK
jgi:hypothetical protein